MKNSSMGIFLVSAALVQIMILFLVARIKCSNLIKNNEKMSLKTKQISNLSRGFQVVVLVVFLIFCMRFFRS